MRSVSILARPVGRALHGCTFKKMLITGFNPRPPRGASATASIVQWIEKFKFQSSPAPWGERYVIPWYTSPMIGVSILARPVGRALRCFPAILSLYKGFNPRPPRGASATPLEKV